MPTITAPFDDRSANVQLWRLDLVSGRLNRVADMGDIYGVSSMAATRDFVFAVVVERNEALITALNRGEIPPETAPTDMSLDVYMPSTVLWRISLHDGEMVPLTENVWGVTARPN